MALSSTSGNSFIAIAATVMTSNLAQRIGTLSSWQHRDSCTFVWLFPHQMQMQQLWDAGAQAGRGNRPAPLPAPLVRHPQLLLRRPCKLLPATLAFPVDGPDPCASLTHSRLGIDIWMPLQQYSRDNKVSSKTKECIERYMLSSCTTVNSACGLKTDQQSGA